MKNEQKIYEIKKDIENNKEYLTLKIKVLESQENKLMDICNHSLVFSLMDTNHHKNGTTSIHFCPACLKMTKIYNEQKNYNYPFNNSNLINLGKCNFKNCQSIFQNIQKIVFIYPEFYYNFDIDEEEKIMEINALLEFEEIIKPKRK